MKKRIDAKQIVSDIRGGMDEAGLRRKYGLSNKGLKTIYRKLLDNGLVTTSDISRRRPSTRTPRIPVEPARQRAFPREIAPWRCPLCNSDFPREYEECPKCGAVAAKIASHQHVAHGMPGPLRARYEQDSAAPTNQWAVVAVSLAVFALVGAAIVSWSVYRSSLGTGGGLIGQSHGSSNVKRFTVDNFNREVMDASETYPVLIEFYADW